MSQSQQLFDQPTRSQPGQRDRYRRGTPQQAPQRPQGTQPGAEAGGATGGGRRPLLFPTQNYLPPETRVPVAGTLNRVLADTTVLITHAKFAHWNLKGGDFYGLHELFDEVAEELAEHADEVGERIAALGAQAMGTAGMAVENCSLPPMPAEAVTGMEYVEILAERLAIHDANLYDAIQTAQGYGDPDTADLLNEISREVSQQLWFLEAHLQTEPVGTVPVDGAGGGQEGTVPPGGSAPRGGSGAQGGGVQPAGSGNQPDPSGQQYPSR